LAKDTASENHCCRKSSFATSTWHRQWRQRQILALAGLALRRIRIRWENDTRIQTRSILRSVLGDRAGDKLLQTEHLVENHLGPGKGDQYTHDGSEERSDARRAMSAFDGYGDVQYQM
jgi:hypothetical protein